MAPGFYRKLLYRRLLLVVILGQRGRGSGSLQACQATALRSWDTLRRVGGCGLSSSPGTGCRHPLRRPGVEIEAPKCVPPSCSHELLSHFWGHPQIGDGSLVMIVMDPYMESCVHPPTPDAGWPYPSFPGPPHSRKKALSIYILGPKAAIIYIDLDPKVLMVVHMVR